MLSQTDMQKNISMSISRVFCLDLQSAHAYNTPNWLQEMRKRYKSGFDVTMFVKSIWSDDKRQTTNVIDNSKYIINRNFINNAKINFTVLFLTIFNTNKHLFLN